MNLWQPAPFTLWLPTFLRHHAWLSWKCQLSVNRLKDLLRPCWTISKNFEQNNLFPSVFVCALCSSCGEAHEDALKNKNAIFFDCTFYTQKMSHNSVLILRNLSDIMGLSVKFTDIQHHFQHFADMSLIFPTKLQCDSKQFPGCRVDMTQQSLLSDPPQPSNPHNFLFL